MGNTRQQPLQHSEMNSANGYTRIGWGVLAGRTSVQLPGLTPSEVSSEGSTFTRMSVTGSPTPHTRMICCGCTVAGSGRNLQS